jgi:tRNA A37 threonylcarbamoyladenosine biosynthesis protein TsaE
VSSPACVCLIAEDGCSLLNFGVLPIIVFFALTSPRIHHMDLYRLLGTSSKEFEPLALPHVFSHCISLIEWPCRMAGFPEVNPPKENLLQVDMTIRHSSDERIVTLTASADSSWRERLQHLLDEGMLDDLLIEEEN